MRSLAGFTLGYCSNIHPGESWEAHFAELKAHLPPVRAAWLQQQENRTEKGHQSDQLFGFGLRLSAQAVAELSQPDVLTAFKHWLLAQGCFVFSINAFPYGRFHGAPVKQAVYRPDWRERERLEYSLAATKLLAQLMPETLAFGSVSSVPLGFAADFTDAEDLERAAEHLREMADGLAAMEQQTGRRVVLALEPEPACVLETTKQVVQFFERFFSSERGEAQRRYLGVCLDCCHQAVQFESAASVINRLNEAGIAIAKLQLSSALAGDSTTLPALKEFIDPVYLHQTVLRDAKGSLHRFIDLPDFLKAMDAVDGVGVGVGVGEQSYQWRSHFHVPIHQASFGGLGSTQGFLREALENIRTTSDFGPLAAAPHLEIETYTWSVLPQSLQEDVDTQISRELAWVASTWK